jgi:hypothetical protein
MSSAKMPVTQRPKPIKNAAVAGTFAAYPPKVRRKLMALRRLIFKTAAGMGGGGEIDETLKWVEPAYVTAQSKTGSTIRIGWKKSKPSQYAMYFHCQTSLVETFRTLFPNDFRYEGNRAIVFHEDDVVPADALSFCIEAALTYHRKKTR